MIDFEVLFDPFAGTGTILLCAKAKGKKSIGIEQNSKFCDEIVRFFG
jgi:DNA modification methylase